MKFVWNTRVWLQWVHLFQDAYFGIQPKGPVNFQCQNFIYFMQSMCHMTPNPEGYQITLHSALFSLSLFSPPCLINKDTATKISLQLW